jgi:hypothetical protein
MLRRGLAAFKTQELSNAVWAHATTQLANARFFVAVEKEALARGLGAFSPQVVCVRAFFFFVALGAVSIFTFVPVKQVN